VRVLQVYRTYFPDPQGGLQEAIRQVACATAAFGVASRVFTLSPSPVPAELERPEGRVVRSRSWAAPASCDLGGPDAFRRFREQARWADVVHFHYPWPFADLLRLASPAGKPCVMTYHSDVVRQRVLGALYRPLMRRTLAAMDAIVATSQDYLESSPVLSTLGGASRPRVIPLGIVEESYAGAVRDARAIDLAARFGAEPGSYFLAVGVLRYYKGLHTLVEAAARSGRRVLIAGSGPERERLARQIAQTGAPVELLGFVSEAEKVALIAGSIGLVLPSHLRSEAFGMVLVEAAMLGRPMISCALSTGTTFVNAGGTTGLVVPPERPEELAAAMDALALDRPRAAAMGVAARARYERLFSGPALGSGYAELYRAVVAGAAARAGGVGILE
jgi:glycosyltransferase involved in cell wall biosynthesis